MKTDLYNKVAGQIVSSLERGVRRGCSRGARSTRRGASQAIDADG
jgi:hypothetical protein